MHIIFSFLFLASFSTVACDEGIARKNNLSIPINSILANGMTEAQFRKVTKDFEDFFRDYVESDFNGDLIVYASWKSNTVNAYAEQEGKKMRITLYGGLARHKSMNLDSVSLTLCHELGHHLGGYPKKSGNKWSSAEGQADYYATMKCARRLWEKDDNEAAIANLAVPALVMQECAKTYTDKKSIALCARTSMAGEGLALLFQDLEQDSIRPKFDTPSDLVTRTMNYLHPYNQCRLDTYFQGSLCHVDKLVEFADDDQVKGACHTRAGDKRGLRPRCWFVPEN